MRRARAKYNPAVLCKCNLCQNETKKEWNKKEPCLIWKALFYCRSRCLCACARVCVKYRWWNGSRNIFEVLWLMGHLSSTSGAVSALHHSGSGSDEVLIQRTSTWKQVLKVHLSAEVGRTDGSRRLGGSFRFKWSRNWMKSFKQYKFFLFSIAGSSLMLKYKLEMQHRRRNPYWKLNIHTFMLNCFMEAYLSFYLCLW